MIVTETLAFYGPPKTGTTAVRTWLGGEMHGGQHNYVPELVQGRVVFCTLRNPYDRAASLWKHHLREHPGLEIGFEEYLETSISGIDWPQSWYIREHDICVDVGELDIPIINHIDRPVPWTMRAILLVCDRYWKDFGLCEDWGIDVSMPT